MITILLLLPVVGILVWLYWYLLPARRWRVADSVVLAVVLTLAVVFVGFVEGMEFEHAGPMWSFIVAAAGAYGILAIGLSVGLAWRRRHPG